jgi:hypothetical protein
LTHTGSQRGQTSIQMLTTKSRKTETRNRVLSFEATRLPCSFFRVFVLLAFVIQSWLLPVALPMSVSSAGPGHAADDVEEHRRQEDPEQRHAEHS